MLADHLNEDGEVPYPRHKVPASYRPYKNITGGSGEIAVNAAKADAEEAELLKLANLDPTVWRISSPTPEVRGWQTHDERWLHYFKFQVQKRAESIDLPALFAAGRKAARAATPKGHHGPRGAVVVWADPQTGKTGSRGGTAELIERVAMKRRDLAEWLKRQNPDACLFVDVGDGIEGFENTPGQLHTNDLPLMDQLDVEATMEFEMISTMARRAPTKVLKTTSNHAAWRAGKGYLGKPGDDWGLYLGKQLRKMFALLPKLDVEFFSSGQWDHSVAIDFMGTIIGAHHGHMVTRPQAIPDWWAKQTHGAGAVADADILLTGHFHHLIIQPTGRNRLTGKVKWWLQAPTLDNGSDWYRNLQGDDSDPGLLVFMVDEHGFDLSSLTVL